MANRLGNQKDFIHSDVIFEFLKKSPLLQNIPLEEINYLSVNSKVMPFKKGNVIFRAGDPSNWIYFIYRGLVVEFVAYSSSVDVIVKTRKKQEYIGEMGMLIDEPYPNTAVAMSPLYLIAIPKEVFLQITWKHHSVQKFIIRELVDRLTNSAKKYVTSMYLDAPGRLAFTLVSLATQDENEIHTINVTQGDVAASAGIARQTAAKIIGEWREQDIIQTLRGQITIKDIDALLDIIIDSELNQ